MPGFVFWGLFVVFAIVVAAYVLWMWWVERAEQDRGGASSTLPRAGGLAGEDDGEDGP